MAYNQRQSWGCHTRRCGDTGSSQRGKIGKIRNQIERDQRQRANQKSEGESTLRVDGFSGCVGCVLPSFVSPKHADHRQTKADDGRCRMRVRNGVAEHRMVPMPKENSTDGQNRADFDGRGHVQHVGAAARAEHIHDRDHKNHQCGDGFHVPRRQRDKFAQVAAESHRESRNGPWTNHKK